MSTDVYIYILKQVFESLVTYSEVKNLQLFMNYMAWEVSHYNGPKVTEVMGASVIYLYQ